MTDAPAAAPAPAATATPSSTAAATPSPSPAQGSAPEPQGIEKLVSGFDKLVLPKTEPEPKPEPKTKPDGKPAADKKPDAKPPTTVAPDKNTPAPKLYEAHEHLKKRVSKELEPELARLRRENEELKARKPEAPEMKEFETVKQERERLAKELAESAYERSDDFRRDYLEPRKAIYDDAVREIAGLAVNYNAGTDEEGKPIIKQRQATEQDFRAIFHLPPAQQDQAIQSWFGASAHRVAHYIQELRRNEREAQLAIRRNGETHESRQRETANRTKAEQASYQSTFAAAQEHLEKKWPQYFKAPATDGDNADKELAEAHQAGFDEVRKFVAEAPKTAAEERAAWTAVVMSRAGAFPRVVLELERAKTRIADLETQISKKQNGDPGSAQGSTALGGAPEEDGIDAMAAKFDAAVTAS